MVAVRLSSYNRTQEVKEGTLKKLHGRFSFLNSHGHYILIISQFIFSDLMRFEFNFMEA